MHTYVILLKVTSVDVKSYKNEIAGILKVSRLVEKFRQPLSRVRQAEVAKNHRTTDRIL